MPNPHFREWQAEARSNSATSLYTNSRAWRTVKDSRVDYPELLVAGNHKRSKEGRKMWSVPENEK